VEVRVEGQTLVIQGAGIGEPRREQIRHALDSVDGLNLSFEGGAPPPLPGGRAAGATKAAPEAPLRGMLGAKLPSGVALDEAVDRILDTSDAMLAQAFALHTLAERFPHAQEAALGDADRASLLRLRDDYSREFLGQVEGLRQLLSPIVAVRPAAAGDAGEWQGSAAVTLAAAKRLDSVLSAAFASSAPTAPPDQMVRRLDSALRDAVAASGGAR
jgi:hypothetical protein